MPEESVELEEVQIESAESAKDLEDFDWTQYVSYFPSNYTDHLTTVFTEEKYGWKARARELKRIDYHTKCLGEAQQDLLDGCEGRKARGPRVIAPREGLRAFLTSITNEKLSHLCQEYTVSYPSFMKPGQEARDELIEALIDEMLS